MPNNPLRKLVRKHEASIARDLNGRTTPASGAMQNFRLKGDVVSRLFRVECKLTQKKSYSVSRAVLDKIEHEALANCQSPLLSLEIDQERYAVMRWQDFIALCRDAKYL